MFFQLRRSAGAFEKFHGAVIDHAGHEHTRVFSECAELGRELRQLGDTLLGATTKSKVAIVFDWDNWWAIEHSSGPTKQLKYLRQIQRYYDAFYNRSVQVDMIGLETELSGYDLVIAPVLYMVKPGYAAKLEAYTAGGGTFVTTFFSGIVQETDLVTLGGYPGELRKLLGIWVEEIDPLFPGQTNTLVMKESAVLPEGVYSCALLCERLHTEGAETVAVYGGDFYAGMPAITRNRFGKGESWYIASDPEAAFLEAFFEHLTDKLNIVPAAKTPPGVEASVREKDGRQFTFLLNHNDRQATVQIGEEPSMELLSGMRLSGESTLPPYGVFILEGPSKGAGPRDER